MANFTKNLFSQNFVASFHLHNFDEKKSFITNSNEIPKISATSQQITSNANGNPNENKLLALWQKVKKPPKGQRRKPLQVNVGIYLESLGNFLETQMVIFVLF